MQIMQAESYAERDWWVWSVWIGGSEQELDEVKAVEWRLHPTFPSPVRLVSDRATAFRLTSAGWGTFAIIANIQFKDGRTNRLRHQLELHYPDGRATTA